jgi:hypothetical protein
MLEALVRQAAMKCRGAGLAASYVYNLKRLLRSPTLLFRLEHLHG